MLPPPHWWKPLLSFNAHSLFRLLRTAFPALWWSFRGTVSSPVGNVAVKLQDLELPQGKKLLVCLRGHFLDVQQVGSPTPCSTVPGWILKKKGGGEWRREKVQESKLTSLDFALQSQQDHPSISPACHHLPAMTDCALKPWAEIHSSLLQNGHGHDDSK